MRIFERECSVKEVRKGQKGLGDADKSLTCSQLSLIIASSSVSGNEGQVIGEIMKQRAILSTEQPLLAHNEHSTQIQSVEA